MHTQAHERPSHEQPDSTELNFEQLEVVSGGLMATVIANLANMRHESLKAVAQNLRA
jgi:hypothetical protein